MNKREIFITREGREIPLRRVSPILIEKVRQSIVMPSPPTYEVETVGGDKEIHVHDTTTLQSDADRAAWTAYEATLRAAEAQSTERLLRLLYVRAGGDVLPEDDSWTEEHRYLGLEVPSEPLDCKVYYIQTELLTHAEDIPDFMLAVFALIGVDEEVIGAAENSFRDSLRTGERENTDTGSGQPEPQGEVVAQPTLRGTGHSQSVGDDTRRVGRSRRR